MAECVLSITMAALNPGEYLGRSLRSVAAQTFQDYEVIVIDDGSTDGSIAQAEGFDKTTVIHNETNLGFSVAHNRGMRMARGRYIVPLSCDIELTPTFLEEMVAAAETSDEVGSVAGKVLRMEPDGTRTDTIDCVGLIMPRNRFPIRRGAGEMDNGQYDQVEPLFGVEAAVPLYRREMLEDIAYNDQFFDESYFMWYEDVDLQWRAQLRGWECLYTPRAIAYHVGHPNLRKDAFFVAMTIRNRWRHILTNECAHCFVRNAPWLLAEELALLRYVLTSGLAGPYWQALRSFVGSLPASLRKRRWVRGRAVRQCLPEYSVKGARL